MQPEANLVPPTKDASYGRVMKRPRLSPALFALICLAFVLPFATVSCDNAKTSFTGLQLVTHTVPSGGAVHEGSDCSGDLSGCVEASGSFLVTLALALSAIGLLLGLLGSVQGPGWFATGGFLTMLGIAGQAVMSMATVEFRVGYWLVLLLFFGAVCLHAWNAVRRHRSAPPEDVRPLFEPQPGREPIV